MKNRSALIEASCSDCVIREQALSLPQMRTALVALLCFQGALGGSREALGGSQEHTGTSDSPSPVAR